MSVSSAHYRPGEGCLSNTRVALLKDVDTWLKESSNETMAWVYGYAGSGKSALLNSIAKNLENADIPFTVFTCKRDDAERSDVQRILPTVCYDFTQFYGDYRGAVSNIVDRPAGRSIPTGDVTSQSELLFGKSPSYDVISPANVRRPHVHVILIDALDECKDARQRSALAHFFRDLANNVRWIKVIISSRREPDIVDALDTGPDVHRIDINSRDWKANDDIRRFIQAEMKRVKLDHLPELESPLVERASGLFIWCTTLFRYVEKSGDKETVLRSVLASPSSSNKSLTHIYDLYRYVVASAVPPGYPDDSELMHKILGTVLATAGCQPVSITAMSELINLKEKYEWVATITRRLHAILYEDPSMSGAVRVCHPSVLDFLLMQFEAHEYSVNLAGIHTLVLNECFNIMDRNLRFNICELENSFRLNKDVPNLPTRISKHITEALRYAALFWLSHLEQPDIDVRKSAEKTLAFLSSVKGLYWIEVLSLMDAVDQGIVELHDCAGFFTVRLFSRKVMQQLIVPRMN